MINEVSVQSVVNNSMMEMSAYSLLNRALPDLRDGLKPVNRRIIISMYNNKTTNLTKSATVEGRVMGLHPHGGSYGSIVSLVQTDKQTLPFLIGKGSWGKYTSSDQQAGAARYTEVKLGKNALEIVKELKEKSVRYIPNYDGTEMIPEVLPVTYPTILTQSQEGMAIGFSSAILSYNSLELLDAIKSFYSNKKIPILYPDFPTGGQLFLDDEAADEIMKTGRGSLKIRANMFVEDNSRIIVNELPYGVKREKVISKIIELNKKGKLKEVTDIRDGTSRKGLKIVIKFRKGTDANLLIEKLYHLTPLQTSVSANMNVLHEGYPKVIGTENMLIEWLKYRESVIKTGMVNKLKSMADEIHLLLALEIIYPYIDEIIQLIRFSKDSEVINKLISEYKLDETQADYVSKMTLRSLNEDRIQAKIFEIKERKAAMEKFRLESEDDDFIKNEVVKRMEETLKAINAPKRKTIIKEMSTEKIQIAKEIRTKINTVENYIASIKITKAGWIFKSLPNEKFVSEPIYGDEVIADYNVENNSQLAIVLEDGQIGRLDVDKIPTNTGLYIPLHFEVDKIISVLVQTEDTKYTILGFDDGQLVKIPTTSFINNRTIMQKGYYTGAKLVYVQQIGEDFTGSFRITRGKKTKDIEASQLNAKASRQSRGQSFIGKAPNTEFDFVYKYKK